MKSHFRSTVPGDAGSISRLLQRVFGMPPSHPGLSFEQMYWKYWREGPDWPGSRGFVMERDGAVIAHGAVIPLMCEWADRRLRLAYLVDWAAQRDCTGAGIALLKRVGQMVEGIFTVGGSESTQKILPALGFQMVGTAIRFILPLRVLARLPDSFRSPRSAARLARNLVLSVRRGRPGITPQGWDARRVPLVELGAVRFPTPHASGATAVFVRSATAIGDLLECPSAPAEFYIVEHEGLARGYFVLTLAGRQGRIAEAWVDGLAIREARAHRHIAELVGIASTSVEAQAFRDTGFPTCGRFPIRLWMRDGRIPEAIRYQMADSDAAYLNDGL
jgi:hypothetical protein